MQIAGASRAEVFPAGGSTEAVFGPVGASSREQAVAQFAATMRSQTAAKSVTLSLTFSRVFIADLNRFVSLDRLPTVAGLYLSAFYLARLHAFAGLDTLNIFVGLNVLVGLDVCIGLDTLYGLARLNALNTFAGLGSLQAFAALDR